MLNPGAALIETEMDELRHGRKASAFSFAGS
jgi:hypothetical protein